MTHPIIEEIEKSQMKDSEIPNIRVGDTVRVAKLILEGKKKRIQRFEGTVIKMTGRLSRKSMTIRKVLSGNYGVEKSFLLHSPLLSEITIIEAKKVRRARLYYLRDRVGAKANRLKARS
ncbi:MAG: 50S ribosomal protein L19 [Actinobacteria bacterium]|nr:50S ribosomal protein L19 [Actinomycetota bacterium]|tara:strand:+ start:286 stop:642 length:357 start_codon:yes stop_codon:yes gene_type:complete